MGADERVFEIKCGCCGARIQVDPRTRSVFYTENPRDKEKSFEERVDKATQGSGGAVAKFEAGLQEEKDRKEKLEQLFRDASEKAAEDPNERPSIWDYE